MPTGSIRNKGFPVFRKYLMYQQGSPFIHRMMRLMVVKELGWNTVSSICEEWWLREKLPTRHLDEMQENSKIHGWARFLIDSRNPVLIKVYCLKGPRWFRSCQVALIPGGILWLPQSSADLQAAADRFLGWPDIFQIVNVSEDEDLRADRSLSLLRLMWNGFCESGRIYFNFLKGLT